MFSSRSGGQNSKGRGGSSQHGVGSGGGGGESGGFGTKSAASSTAGAPPGAAASSFSGGNSAPGFGSGATGSSFGATTFASPAGSAVRSSGIFGSGSGFASSAGDAKNSRSTGATDSGFGGAPATSRTGTNGKVAGFGTGGFGTLTRGSGGSVDRGSDPSFGSASSSGRTGATSNSPTWASVASATPSTRGFGTGGGFGSGGGFGAGAKPAATGRNAWGSLSQPKSMPTSNFGSGGGFGDNGGPGAAGSSLQVSTFGGDTKKQLSTKARNPLPGGFAGAKMGSSGGSFADAAKRGALSSTGKAPADGAPTSTSISGFGGIAPAAKPASSDGFRTSTRVGKRSSAADALSGGLGGGRFRTSTRNLNRTQMKLASPAPQPPVDASLSWDRRLLIASGKGTAGKARKRISAGGDGDGGTDDRGTRQNDPGSRGSRKDKPSSRVSGLGAAVSASQTGSGRIMGGFDGPPPGAATDAPAFVGGGGREGGGDGKSKSSRAPSTRASKVLGGFGGPPPGASEPPSFVGGGGAGSGSGSGRSKPATVRSTTAGSKILGGFGGPPPGASTDPPSFVGGGSGGGGGFGASSVSGPDGSEDTAANARRAQRFAGSLGGGGGGGSSRTRGAGGSSSNGSGAGGNAGGGAAEDVQRGSHLDDAEIKVGTVEAMCPLEESLRRVPGDLHILEKEHPALFMPDKGNGAARRLWLHDDLVVKRHQRAAAGMDISKPELLRTPPWLAYTVDHLVMNCVDKGPHGGGDPAAAWEDPRVEEYMAKFRANNPSRADCAEEETEHDLYNFVWDRFRMVRSDYNMQGYNPVVGLVSEASVVAHERMARWYVLMANRMERNSMATHRFNLKSIVETLKKLYEFYTIRVARGEVVAGLASPNEPEIMAYYLLTVLEQDDGVEVQRLVKDLVRSRREQVLESPEIKGALRVVRAWHAGDYVAFFRALRHQGVMHRCLLAQYVKSMRNTAINVIGASFLDIHVSEVTRLMCFESNDQTATFLAAYNLQVLSSGWVNLREKVGNSYRIQIRRPDAIPDPPPLQDLVEPKPWRKASEWVFNGDSEPAADKSHDVVAPPVPLGSGASSASGAAAAVLRRATSSSSTSSALSAGGGGLRARVAGRAVPVAATVSTGRRTVPRQSSRTDPGTSPAVTSAAPSSFADPSSSGVSVKTSTPPARGAGFVAGREGGTGPAASKTSAFYFVSAAGTASQAATKASSSDQPKPATTAATVGSTPAFPSPGGGFVFGPHDPVATSKQDPQTTSTGIAPGPGALRSGPSPSAGGSASRDKSGANDSGAGRAGSSSDPPTNPGSLPHGGGGVGTASGEKTSVVPGVTFTAAPVNSSQPAGVRPTSPTFTGAGAAPGSVPNLAVPSGGLTNASASGVSFAPPAPPAAAAPGATRSAGPDIQARGAGAVSAAAATAADEAERSAVARKQQAEARAAEENRRREDAAARRKAALALEAKAKRVRDAEEHARNALSAGKLVPADVVHQLPRDGDVRRLALEHRHALGLRLAQLGPRVVRRKRSSAWGVWIDETRRWMEEQRLVELRNRRFEEHSALTENAYFLRRKTRRSLSGSRDVGAAGQPTKAAALSAGVVKGTKPASARRSTVESQPLHRPDPLNLASLLALGLAKNQGAYADEAFRAVGLTTPRNPGKRSAVEEGLLSPPHLFWKAVVVAPSRTRGDVGGWLEAKLGAAGAASSVPASSEYRRDLASEGVCPALQEGDALGMEDGKEVECGVSGSAKLIYRALRKLPTDAPSGTRKSITPSQWIHLCVQRVSVRKGSRLQHSPPLSATLMAASVVVFAATPTDQDRFFWSPLQPKPDWSLAREDLRTTLESASLRGGIRTDPEFWGVPVLVVIPVKDSALQRGDGEDPTTAERIRASILQDAWEGLGLKGVAELGFSFRVVLVGLHEFESRSKAAAASTEGLVFAGGVEQSSSEDLAAKLAELAEQAPRQPLIATRSLQEMLNTAVSRATTDDRYAAAVGLTLPVSRLEDPPLNAVVEAASRATTHVRRLLERKSDNWPMPEFAVRTSATGQSGNVDGGQGGLVSYVPGAARPAGGEIAVSPLLSLSTAGVDTDACVTTRLRLLVEASGGLPLGWTSSGPSRSGDCPKLASSALMRAATLPPMPSELAVAFSPEALAGRQGSRALGASEAWARVEHLDAYLGKGLMPEELRYRLAESLAGGILMRGSPPPWRTLVRDAVSRRVMVAGGRGGGGGESPLVVHFVAAYGQERLASRSDLVVPGLLEAEDFRVSLPAPRASTLAKEDHGQEDMVLRASAALKRVAPIMADARPTKHNNKHRRTNSCASQGGNGGGASQRRLFFGSGSRAVIGNPSSMDIDDDARLLQERVSRIALQTQEVRASRERAASFATADRDLDDAFLASFGISLPGSRGGAKAPPVPSFDRNRVTSLRLDAAERARPESEADRQEYEIRRRRAETTLPAREYKCWVVREEIKQYRRQEEKLQSEIFNGDPLLPL